jgi:hypothetical protein
MKVLISVDIFNNRIYVNNIYEEQFIGEIIIEYHNEIVYKNNIELVTDSILWYSPYTKITDVSKIIVTLKETNGNIFYSTVPLVYTGTFMRLGKSELNDLCDFIKNDNYNIENIVEIGSYQGESTTIFSNNFKNSLIFAVDIWVNNYDESEVIINTNNPKDVENNFDIITKNYNNIIKIKLSSEKFSNIISDNSIDFVYIDGDHSYDGVTLDIVKWKNKVKHGGYIGGHDYVENRHDLIKAVKENFPNYKINIFGWSWLIKIL